MRANAALALAPALLALSAPAAAGAAEPPGIESAWVTDVTATSVDLRARIDPEPAEPRPTASNTRPKRPTRRIRPPTASTARRWRPPLVRPLGSGTSAQSVSQHLGAFPLDPLPLPAGGDQHRREGDRPRAPSVTQAATNVERPIRGPLSWSPRSTKTAARSPRPAASSAAGSSRPPPRPPSSPTARAPPLAARRAPRPASNTSRPGAGGWSSENVSTTLLSDGYGPQPDGVPYRVFSADLSRALLLDPRRCDAEEPCPRTYSLRESATGALTPLPAEAAGMRVLEASPDLGRILFEDEAGGVWAWNGGRRWRRRGAAGTGRHRTGQRRRAAPGLPLGGGNPALRQHRREHGRTGHRALPGRPAARRRPLAAPLRLLQPERRTPRRLGLDPRRAPERHHRHL